MPSDGLSSQAQRACLAKTLQEPRVTSSFEISDFLLGMEVSSSHQNVDLDLLGNYTEENLTVDEAVLALSTARVTKSVGGRLLPTLPILRVPLHVWWPLPITIWSRWLQAL